MTLDEGPLVIDSEMREVLAPLFGKACCRQRVGKMRSLSLGFGPKVKHGKSGLSDDFYGEWEVGTYSGSWRVVRDGRVVCGSTEVVDSLEELDGRIRSIVFGRLAAIEMVSKLDIRLVFEDGTHIDILATSSEGDELFHVFCPDHMFVEYTAPGIWKLGKSNLPWP
jgi:hypothetical protein